VGLESRIPCRFPKLNPNARRARRMILEKLRVMRTANAADMPLDAMLENYIFYISRMYEFSHSLDLSRPSNPSPLPVFVRCWSNRRQILRRSEMSRCANRQHALVRKSADVFLGKLHKFQRRTAVQVVGIAKDLAHLEMVEVRCFDQFDWLAGRLHRRGKIAALAVCCVYRKLDSTILMVKAAENWV
jgi:hypothetical protein